MFLTDYNSGISLTAKQTPALNYTTDQSDLTLITSITFDHFRLNDNDETGYPMSDSATGCNLSQTYEVPRLSFSYNKRC